MMQQNSDEWLDYRRRKIGASDLPIIMGLSPWKTAIQLLDEKWGITKPNPGNWATQRGNDLEPKARSNFELLMGGDWPATLAVHAQHTYCAASLDGYNKETNEILEIKCPGKEDHAIALAGQIPEKYKPQVHWQIFITGATKCYYYSFDGENGAKPIEVYPDIEYCKILFKAATVFWGYMQTKTYPPLTDRDQIELTEQRVVDLATSYARIDSDIKKLEAEQKMVKEEIVKACTHTRTKIGNISVTRSISKGAVDYSKIEGVDFEQYRKEPISKVTIRVEK